MNIKDNLKKLIAESLDNEISVEEIIIEIPADKKNGDFSSNVAMKSCKKLNKKPLEIAEIVKNNIKDELFFHYFEIGKVINKKCKMIIKLDTIYQALLYINKNIENFNKDELILSKNILKVTKYVINKAKTQKNLNDDVLIYCDNLQNEIKDKLKEPNL